MFGSENIKSLTISLEYDPGANDEIPIFVAPEACEILSATATVANDIAASGTDYFSVALKNGGSDGSGTTAIAAAVGGANTAWTGLTPKSFTISEGTLAAGDVVKLAYTEAGVGTFTQLTIQLNYVSGIGA